MMTVFLFYTGSSGYLGIEDAKYSVFLTFCGGYILLMLLMIGEMTLFGKPPVSSLKKRAADTTWLQRLILIYLGLTWLSALLSPYFPVTVIGATRHDGALTITIYCITFLFVSAFGRIEKWMLPLLAGSVSAFDILCILQLYGLNPFTLYPEGYNYFGANVDYGGAYLGTIGNVDLVAAFLCLVIPIFWIGLVRCKSDRRWLLLIPLVLSVFVLLKMWVLAGLVGVVCGSLVSLCVVLPVSTGTKKLLRGALALGAAAALALLFLVDAGSGLFHELHLLLRGQAEDSFGSGRIHIWRSVLERIPEQLWLGSGPDTMALAELEPFTRFDENRGMLIVSRIDIAHNEYLNILFHQGLPAAVSYLAALAFAARDWLHGAQRNAAAAAFGGAALCWCIQAFFGISSCAVTPGFWVILGLLSKNIHKTEEH